MSIQSREKSANYLFARFGSDIFSSSSASSSPPVFLPPIHLHNPAPTWSIQFTIFRSSSSFLFLTNNIQPITASSKWAPVAPKSSEKPQARWHHTATAVDRKIVVFGGFQDNTKRFNDVWVFDTHTLKWSQPIKLRSESEISGGGGGGGKRAPTPQPRGEHAACQMNGSVYIFGGYGGPDWSRRDFNDLYALDTMSWGWKIVNPGNQLFGAAKQVVEENSDSEEEEPEIFPEPRASHTLSALGTDKLVLFGGWNSKEQFSDVWIFSLETSRWSELEIAEPLSEPRWSHGAIVAESIPHDQLYVFGGSSGEITKKNVAGRYSQDLWMLDLIDGRWTKVKCKNPPKARSDSELAYSESSRNLYVFGGWSNKWYKDMWSNDCGPYVGELNFVLFSFPPPLPSAPQPVPPLHLISAR